MPAPHHQCRQRCQQRLHDHQRVAQGAVAGRSEPRPRPDHQSDLVGLAVDQSLRTGKPRHGRSRHRRILGGRPDLNAPLIQGIGTADDVARIAAGNVTLQGATTAGTGSVAGQGTLQINSANLTLGPGAINLAGFGAVTLTGTAQVAGNGTGVIGVAGDLTVVTSRLRKRQGRHHAQRDRRGETGSFGAGVGHGDAGGFARRPLDRDRPDRRAEYRYRNRLRRGEPDGPFRRDAGRRLDHRCCRRGNYVLRRGADRARRDREPDRAERQCRRPVRRDR